MTPWRDKAQRNLVLRIGRAGGWKAGAAGLGLVAALVSCGSEEQQAEPPSTAPPGAAPTTAPPHPQDMATCGTSYGPDGLLDIVVIAGPVDCLSAKIAADEYMGHVDGFITNEPLEIANGWLCWPASKAVGEIVQCNEGRQAVSLQRR